MADTEAKGGAGRQTVVVVDGTPYTISADESGNVFINGKEVKTHAPDAMPEDEKEVYQITLEIYPSREREARLLGALNVFYTDEDHPHINGDGTLMGLFDGFCVRLATGKAVAARYVVEGGEIRVPGGKSAELPSLGSDMLDGIEFSKLIGELTKPAWKKVTKAELEAASARVEALPPDPGEPVDDEDWGGAYDD